MSRRGRAGANDGESKRHRQHREDAVNDRQPGDEVEGDRDSPALLVRDGTDGERHCREPEGDGDPADAAVAANGEGERREGADDRQAGSNPESPHDALVSFDVLFHVRNLASFNRALIVFL